MSKKPPFAAGDNVSLERWDAYERPVNRMGDCVVVSVRRAVCQTGFLVTVRSLGRKDHLEMDLDADWLRPPE